MQFTTNAQRLAAREAMVFNPSCFCEACVDYGMRQRTGQGTSNAESYGYLLPMDCPCDNCERTIRSHMNPDNPTLRQGTGTVGPVRSEGFGGTAIPVPIVPFGSAGRISPPDYLSAQRVEDARNGNRETTTSVSRSIVPGVAMCNAHILHDTSCSDCRNAEFYRVHSGTINGTVSESLQLERVTRRQRRRETAALLALDSVDCTSYDGERLNLADIAERAVDLGDAVLRRVRESVDDHGA